MIIAVGTTSRFNIIKIQALEEAVKKLQLDARVLPQNTLPGVPKQPFGFEQIVLGAKNRAAQALEGQRADIGVGIENGLVLIEPAKEWFDVACVAVVTKEGKESIGFSAGFFVPQWIVTEIKEKNLELDVITERLAHEKDPIQYFSNETLHRKEMLIQAIYSAFSKILFEERYHL